MSWEDDPIRQKRYNEGTFWCLASAFLAAIVVGIHWSITYGLLTVLVALFIFGLAHLHLSR